MRVKPADFQRLNLRCHALLSDVPLHDVWAIPLNGGGPGRSIQDARAILFGDRRPPNFAVRGLFTLRSAVGRAFGWDDERHDPPSGSYVNRRRAGHRRATSSRDGEVELDSTVYHAHIWSSGYANALWWVGAGSRSITTEQYRREAYHGEGAQVR
jgi:hypothetical protein